MKRIITLLLAILMICALNVPSFALPQSILELGTALKGSTLSEGSIIIVAIIAVIAVLAVVYFAVKNRKNKK